MTKASKTITIEARDLRTCAGSEGDAFSCILWLNGRPAATVTYAGRGGCYMYDFTMSDSQCSGGPMYRLLRDYVDSLPEEPLYPERADSPMVKPDFDMAVGPAIDAAAMRQFTGYVETSGPDRPRAKGKRKVVSLRMQEDLVDGLDAVRVRHGIKSRMDLFRSALEVYLATLGEHEVAGLIRR